MNNETIRQKSLSAVNNSIFWTVILVAIQVAAWGGFYFLVTEKVARNYAVIFQIVVVILIILMITYIIIRCPHNSYQVSWLILLALMPTVALMMYVILRLVPGTGHLAAKVHEKELVTALHLTDSEAARHDLSFMNNKYVGLFQYLSTACMYPTYYGE